MVWKFRGLSSSSGHFEAEPYHNHFEREGVEAMLSPHFTIRKLFSRYWKMNWYFVCEK